MSRECKLNNIPLRVNELRVDAEHVQHPSRPFSVASTRPSLNYFPCSPAIHSEV